MLRVWSWVRSPVLTRRGRRALLQLGANAMGGCPNWAAARTRRGGLAATPGFSAGRAPSDAQQKHHRNNADPGHQQYARNSVVVEEKWKHHAAPCSNAMFLSTVDRRRALEFCDADHRMLLCSDRPRNRVPVPTSSIFRCVFAFVKSEKRLIQQRNMSACYAEGRGFEPRRSRRSARSPVRHR